MSTFGLKNHMPRVSAVENGGHVLRPELLAELRQFDTCTIANAIERFGVRLRNEGFTRPGLHCVTGDGPPVLGFAATFKVRSSNPPMVGSAYFDRTDWWTRMSSVPEPRIAVFEDLEAEYSSGSTIGEVHAAILQALGCDAVITNGAVRDLPGIRRMGFSVFARTLAVSHAYTHVVDYGSPVSVFGLEIGEADLLCADCHGAVSIPLEIANEIPRVASENRAAERRIIDLCQSPEFSPGKLLDAIKGNQ